MLEEGPTSRSAVKRPAQRAASLKDVYKSFNDVGEALIARLRTFRAHGVHVLGSFIFGLPSDRPSTFRATVDVANRAQLAFAQFVMLTPYPGTVDFEAWEKRLGPDAAHVGGQVRTFRPPPWRPSELARFDFVPGSAK